MARAIEDLGATPVVARQPDDLRPAAKIILPGVGSFPAGMRALAERGLDVALTDLVIARGVPVLGICLGMQLMATWGFEGEPTPGLGWMDAEVRRLDTVAPPGETLRIPHVGWNDVTPVPGARLFAGLAAGSNFYFVHSYHLVPADASAVAAITPYGSGIVASVARGHIFGVQFHPEKSQRTGRRVLRNFLEA